MFSHDNLKMLNQQNYPFIVAARIHNETQALQDDILRRCNGLTNGQRVEIIRNDGYRMIMAYSDQRTKKDAHNRQRGLTRLRKRLGSGKMTKEHLNNRGYNKFLKLSGEVSIEIDEAKIEQAVRWDGLKGYLTSTNLSAAQVIGNYKPIVACRESVSDLEDGFEDTSDVPSAAKTDRGPRAGCVCCIYDIQGTGTSIV